MLLGWVWCGLDGIRDSCRFRIDWDWINWCWEWYIHHQIELNVIENWCSLVLALVYLFGWPIMVWLYNIVAYMLTKETCYTVFSLMPHRLAMGEKLQHCGLHYHDKFNYISRPFYLKDSERFACGEPCKKGTNDDIVFFHTVKCTLSISCPREHDIIEKEKLNQNQ